MARAITSEELSYLRMDGQFSRFGLAIHAPAIVYQSLSIASSQRDQVAQVTVQPSSGGSWGYGSLSNVLPGMTMYVGTSQGAHDLGMVRIRAVPNVNIIYIGEVSDIDWSTPRYLTVVNEYNLWARHWKIPDANPENTRMDYNVIYTDQQQNYDPCPVMGPDWVTYSGTINPSAAGSWVIASTITGFLWSAAGGAAIIGETTATPTIIFPAPGQYQISLTVTAANGKSATAYRDVFYFGGDYQPLTDFEVGGCSGGADNGGWSYSIHCFGSVPNTLIRERAKVILFAIEDIYGTSAVSMGPVAGHENIICMGWIDGESITWNPESGGGVSFSVRGPAHWLGRLYGFPEGVKYTSGNPTSWLYAKGLTVDVALWNLLRWRSTASLVLDITLSGDTHALPAGEAPAGDLWGQLEAIAGAVLAKPMCNRYGQLFVKKDPQQFTQPTSPDPGYPVVMALTDADWEPPIEITRRVAAELAILDASGVAYDGTNAVPFLARAPGYSPKRYGKSESVDRLLISSQSELNSVCGMLLGAKNNEFPNVEIELPSNNRFIDIAPFQYLTLSIETGNGASDRITWTNKRLIPREVEYRIDTKEGMLTVSLNCEAVSTPEHAVMIPVPNVQQPNFSPRPPISGFSVVPGGTYFPPLVVSGGGGGYDDDPDVVYNGGEQLHIEDLVSAITADDWHDYQFPATPNPVPAPYAYKPNWIGSPMPDRMLNYTTFDGNYPPTYPVPDIIIPLGATSRRQTTFSYYESISNPIVYIESFFTRVPNGAPSYFEAYIAPIGLAFNGDGQTQTWYIPNLEAGNYQGFQATLIVSGPTLALTEIPLELSGPGEGFVRLYGGGSVKATAVFDQFTRVHEIDSWWIRFDACNSPLNMGTRWNGTNFQAPVMGMYLASGAGFHNVMRRLA